MAQNTDQCTKRNLSHAIGEIVESSLRFQHTSIEFNLCSAIYYSRTCNELRKPIKVALDYDKAPELGMHIIRFNYISCKDEFQSKCRNNTTFPN